MGKFSALEDIIVLSEAVSLAEKVYKTIRKSRSFSCDFGLRDQMQRSSISISSNIAEGYERESNLEFIRYLYIAKGSCGELRTQLLIASRLDYLKDQDYIIIKNECMKISGMIMNLIKSLKIVKK